ncbi:MAG: hypothetical protein QXP22_02490 [Candidatus Anstonellales archaeon]
MDESIDANIYARNWYLSYFGITLPEHIKFLQKNEKIIAFTFENIGEHFGIVALKKIKNGYKPTTNFLQIFGNLAMKNFVLLDKEQAFIYAKGNDIEVRNIKIFIDEYNFNKFVAVLHNNACLGCGFLSNEKLINQISKSRRINA